MLPPPKFDNTGIQPMLLDLPILWTGDLRACWSKVDYITTLRGSWSLIWSQPYSSHNFLLPPLGILPFTTCPAAECSAGVPPEFTWLMTSGACGKEHRETWWSSPRLEGDPRGQASRGWWGGCPTELHKYNFCFTPVFPSALTCFFFVFVFACGELLSSEPQGREDFSLRWPSLVLLLLLVGFGCFPS